MFWCKVCTKFVNTPKFKIIIHFKSCNAILATTKKSLLCFQNSSVASSTASQILPNLRQGLADGVRTKYAKEATKHQFKMLFFQVGG
jgi:hypothetical protein